MLDSGYLLSGNDPYVNIYIMADTGCPYNQIPCRKAASRDRQLMAVSWQSVPTKNQHNLGGAWVR